MCGDPRSFLAGPSEEVGRKMPEVISVKDAAVLCVVESDSFSGCFYHRFYCSGIIFFLVQSQVKYVTYPSSIKEKIHRKYFHSISESYIFVEIVW